MLVNDLIRHMLGFLFPLVCSVNFFQAPHFDRLLHPQLLPGGDNRVSCPGPIVEGGPEVDPPTIKYFFFFQNKVLIFKLHHFYLEKLVRTRLKLQVQPSSWTSHLHVLCSNGANKVSSFCQTLVVYSLFRSNRYRLEAGKH
ncbi:hypothetical protein ILYODFUR_024622 [Ilyodon furcidens]|uniref:Secreted protein n=1 Tax=Ilyodon furcidens TaxID=33524 RepID=A0ABV0TAS2_9TELE